MDLLQFCDLNNTKPIKILDVKNNANSHLTDFKLRIIIIVTESIFPTNIWCVLSTFTSYLLLVCWHNTLKTVHSYNMSYKVAVSNWCLYISRRENSQKSIRDCPILLKSFPSFLPNHANTLINRNDIKIAPNLYLSTRLD